jgi:SAM-dependent methyltransferase
MLLLRRLFVATLSLAVTARAFTPTSRHNTNKRVSTSTTSSSTRLAALPPMIIGPFLKKMKDEKAAKKAPMADAAQVATEAPGLRVGQGAWKWPRMWPYDTDFFVTSKSYDSAQQKKQLNQVASALNGIAQVPTAENNNGMMLGGSPGAGAAVDENDDDEDTWDSLTYWSSDAQGAVPTVMDPEAVANLKEHYAYYLKDGMSILELGAAEESYLPANLTVSRHVGVGASPAMMKKNPSLTETLVVDLNKAVEGRDVDNDDFRRLAEAPFDAVLMANTVDFLTSPREVVRSAWYLLKPGGVMMIPFSGKEGTKDQFADAKTKMWNDFNDDQHLWMTVRTCGALLRYLLLVCAVLSGMAWRTHPPMTD